MTKFDKKFIYYKLPPVLYAVLIIFVSTIPSVKPPTLGVDNADKFYHCLEYFVLSLLIFRAFPDVHSSARRTLLYGLLFGFGLAFGALDETVQFFVPSRDSSVYDWLADAVGYSLGGFLVILFRSMKKRRISTRQRLAAVEQIDE